jgi:hypothetical protein
VLAACTLGVYSERAGAASSPLLGRAIGNTDALTYYHETDVDRTVEGTTSVTVTSTETYDQKNNRESDHAAFVVVKNNKTQRYSIDVIMMNNQTYFLSTLNKQGWQMKAGFGYVDPVSGQEWVRAPLSFANLGRQKVASQGNAAGGTYHVHFKPVKSAKYKGTAQADLWITTRGTPYVVRYTQNISATVKGKKASETVDTRLSNFNKPVTITAPKLGTQSA